MRSAGTAPSAVAIRALAAALTGYSIAVGQSVLSQVRIVLLPCQQSLMLADDGAVSWRISPV